jgi:hypothetical protein
MPWVIDSCVLLDVALKDPLFGLPSALLLEKMRGDGLVVCPISLVEITPQFGGDFTQVHLFVRRMGVVAETQWLTVDTESAAAGWTRYVLAKRQNQLPKRPVADLLIGGFACRFQGLITRNPSHFEPFYPQLRTLVVTADSPAH